LVAHVHEHLHKFAFELKWTPQQVWSLRYYEYVYFAALLDEIFEQRRRAMAEGM